MKAAKKQENITHVQKRKQSTEPYWDGPGRDFKTAVINISKKPLGGKICMNRLAISEERKKKLLKKDPKETKEMKYMIKSRVYLIDLTSNLI